LSVSAGVTSFALSRAARAQAVGICALLTGACVLAALGLGLAGLDTARWVAVALAALAALVLAVAVVRLMRAPVALELSNAGYRVPTLRGVGVREAAWREVHDVSTQVRGGQQVAVIRLHDSSTTALPVRLVEEPAQVWMSDLDARLNTARGRRRLS
jgi:hypothetical protein